MADSLSNFYDTDFVDYLDDVRKFVARSKAGRSSIQSTIPEYEVAASSTSNVSDSVATPTTSYFILLETGDKLLLESGDKMLGETWYS